MRSMTLFVAAASLFAAMGGAAAADSTSSGSAGADTARLEEVVVTARHREESLQTVPVTVTAISGDQLMKQHIDNFADVINKVPGFVVNPDNVTQPNLFMRGIGTDIRTSASNPGVAVYIDDVYLSRTAALNGDLWDLERAEVLEGPQGTLFGKNAVGGLVNFVTRKPTQTPYATAELSLGNYNTVIARAMASGPLSDTVAASLSFSSQSHDGYETNTLTGGKFDSLSAQTARGHLRFTPSDDLDVTLSGDVTHRRGSGHLMVIGYTTRNQAYVPSSPFAAPVSGPVCSNVTGQQFANDYGNGPLNGPLNCAPPDGTQNVDDYGTSLRIDWKTGLGKLTSLTAYRHSNIFFQANDAGTAFDFAAIDPVYGSPTATDPSTLPDDFYYQQKAEHVSQFSEEIRLASDSSGPLSWMTGLYFLHENIDRDVTENFMFTDIYWYSGTGHVTDNTVGRSYGVFAEGTYRWANNVGVTLGGRYSSDHKDWDYLHNGWSLAGSFGLDANGNQIPTPQGFTAKSSGSWSAFTPNLVIDWKRAAGEYYYVKVARGYQSGGFGEEDSANTPAQAVQQFKPEFAMNYEAGAKFDLLDRKLRINPTIFWTDYTDLQILTLVPGFIATDLISNAGSARARGAKLQVTAAPARGLEIYGNYSYLDCKITGSTPTTAVDGTPIDINGYTCRRAPRNSFNAGTRVEWGAGALGSMFLQADYTWTDKFYFDNDNNSISAVGSQSRLDASLGLQSSDNRWEFSLWAKNLTNQLLVSGRTALVTPNCNVSPYDCSSNSETVFTTYQPPRTYGMTVRWNFKPK